MRCKHFITVAGIATSKDKGRRGKPCWIALHEWFRRVYYWFIARSNCRSLEPLYEKCLQRMREFAPEEDDKTAP